MEETNQAIDNTNPMEETNQAIDHMNPMEETQQVLDPQTFQTPKKKELKSLKGNSNSEVVSSRFTRSRIAPDWTTQEMLTLVRETVAIDAAFLRALPSIQKWKMISDNCTALGVARSSNQCHRKWESLLVDFKKIKDIESKRGIVSYWALENEMKLKLELPISFDEELFRCIDESLKIQGDQSGTDPDSESEAEVEMLNAIIDSDSKKQSGSTQGPQKGKRGRPKRKIIEMAQPEDKIIVNAEPKDKIIETAEPEGKIIETVVQKGRVGRPKSKIIVTAEPKDKIIETTEPEGTIIETVVQKGRVGRPKSKITETAEPKGKITETAEQTSKIIKTDEQKGNNTETVVQRRVGRPKSKIIDNAESEVKITEASKQKSKITETVEQKSPLLETDEQKGKNIETAVQKRAGRPKSKIIEMAVRTRGDVELIHAILRGDLNENKDNDLNALRNPGMLQMELARRQGDDLIEVLGSLIANLNQLTDMVEERG